MEKSFQIDASPLSIEFDLAVTNKGYGIFESKTDILHLDFTTINSHVVLSESDSMLVKCNFQYFLLWLKKKQINHIQFAFINFFFSKLSLLKLTFPLNSYTRLILLNIDIRSFKNYILNNVCFNVFDKQLDSYVEHVEFKQVIDNPAPAIGNSKLVYSYKGEMFHERILELY